MAVNSTGSSVLFTAMSRVQYMVTSSHTSGGIRVI